LVIDACRRIQKRCVVPLNVCLLSDAFPPDVGGLARAVYRHGANLARAGCQVHVVALSDRLPAGEVRVTVEDGQTVHRLGRHPRVCDSLADWTELAVSVGQRDNCPIYHGYFVAYAGFVAACAARLCGGRSVVSARGNDLDRLAFDAEYAPFTFKALGWADAITTVSTELRRKVQALSGRDDAIWIPNSVDTQLFQPCAPGGLSALRQSLSLSEKPIIGFVGEARIKKGLPLLLRAFVRIAPETGAQLLLVGGVREKDRPVLDVFQGQHPDLAVREIPYQPQAQLPPYYCLLDLVVLPSLRDGMPNALLEAMACARATISTKVGGIPDVVTDGQDGWLVPPRDEAALVSRIRYALDDDAARRRIGEAARRTVLARFTPERELEANLALYRRLTGLQSA